MLKIGQVKRAVAKGDRVTVYFSNNKTTTAIATHDITSTNVAVLNGYVFSEDNSLIKNTTTTRLFKSATNYEEAVGCQLVSASIWIARIPLSNVNTIPPYDVTPYGGRVINPDYLGWNYDQQDHLCRGATDGSGVYADQFACMLDNDRSEPDEPFQFSGSGLPRYAIASNGDIAIAGGSVGYQPGGDYRQRIKLDSSLELRGTDLWFRLRVRHFFTGFTEEITHTFVDGSITQIIDGIESPFTGNGYTFDNSLAPTWTKITDTDYNGLPNLPRPTFRGEPFKETTIPNDFLIVDELINSLGSGIDYFRGISYEYPFHTTLTGYFIKIHDPDLPLFKIIDIPPTLFHRGYISFLGTEAYFALKIGKSRLPDTEFDARPWQQIKMFKLKISATGVTIESQQDYFEGDTINLSSKNVLAEIMSQFIDDPTDACLDQDLYLQTAINRFREVHYQKSGSGLVEYKIPGEYLPVD